MDLVQQLLLLSEKLYSTLANEPEDKLDKRDEYIAYINKLLDARGQTIDKIKQDDISIFKTNPYRVQLAELDQGIRERLVLQKNKISIDMQNLQKSKKSEVRYQNPYSAVNSMDGTYYDKKK